MLEIMHVELYSADDSPTKDWIALWVVRSSSGAMAQPISVKEEIEYEPKRKIRHIAYNRRFTVPS